MRFLAELHQRETSVEIERQRVRAHLIERGAAVVRMREFHETADQPRPLAARADRIVQRGPRAAVLRVHEKRLARLGEQKALVAHHREAGVAALLRAENARGIGEVLRRGHLEAARRRAQQLPDGERAREHACCERRAQRTRRALVERELPPQVRVVRHVAEGEEHDPYRDRHHHADGNEPRRREPLGEQRRPAVEALARQDEQRDEERENARFDECEPSPATARSSLPRESARPTTRRRAGA